MLVAAVCVGVFCAFPVNATTLAVPFTPQAPFADWRQPWQDACEESTIVMVDAYYRGTSLDKHRAKKDILQVFRIKEGVHGKSLDENAATMVDIINKFYPWEARAVENPSIDQIKQEIDAKRPVIALTYGRALYNPYFLRGGPDYHTVVISGYDDKKQDFITQEPGTRRGLDFRYSYDRLMSAIHDFVPGKQTKYGRKVVLFTSPIVGASGKLDGDGDGLSKNDELEHGTVLWLADSDGDGYSDGDEVQHGYLAHVNEKQYMHGSLVKSSTRPEVYLLQNSKKQHIASEAVFLKRGWQWNDVHIVSENFLSRFPLGKTIRK